MRELRYNPLLDTWTMVAANRQNRPHLPTETCPFCPESGKVPSEFDVLLYPNDFPTLDTTPPHPVEQVQSLHSPYTTQPAYGYCEVVLYSPNHDSHLATLPLRHTEALVRLWRERTQVLTRDPKIRYVFPFENRGVEVGVTIHHPHGQLYAYPFVPLKIATELRQARSYFERTSRNLFDDMNETERRSKTRVLLENDYFIAYLPHFTDYPYGVFIVTLTELSSLADFEDTHCTALADLLQKTIGMFDHVFSKPFPYMMCIHQTPVHDEEFSEAKSYYRFHIEFYPPLRTETRIKYYASSEMGAWAAANVRSVEETAVELRDALNRYLSSRLTTTL
jgi:UDPglucose--hexose-1-phosphate uridylyltransferase